MKRSLFALLAAFSIMSGAALLFSSPVYGQDTDSQNREEAAIYRNIKIVPVRSGDLMYVHVDMQSFGDEGGTQFTLHFDPSMMSISNISGVNTNPDVSLGSGAPASAVLDINAEHVAQGDLGFIEMFVGYDGRGRVQPGVRRMATITFHMNGSSKGATMVPGLAVTNSLLVAQTVDTWGYLMEVPGGYNVEMTADGLAVSGDVLTADGAGLQYAVVSLTDEDGVQRSTTTSASGDFSFNGLEVGKAYMLVVRSRKYRFAPAVIQPFDNVSDVRIVGTK